MCRWNFSLWFNCSKYIILRRSMSSSLPESSTLPSGFGTPPQKLRSPWGTRTPRMTTHRTDPNMPRRWRPRATFCSVPRSARSSCATSSRRRRLILPHWSKDFFISFSYYISVGWLYNPVTFVLFARLPRMNSDTVDYEDSCLIVRYLASMRPFAQSFDIYLTQVRFEYYFKYLCLLNESLQRRMIINQSCSNGTGDIRVHWFVCFSTVWMEKDQFV